MRSVTVYSVLPIIALCGLVAIDASGYGSQCPEKKVLTYNTALLDMPLSKSHKNNRLERRDAIVEELNRVQADVVCLQEVWLGEDVENIVSNVADMYPYSASKLHRDGVLPCQKTAKAPACNFMDLTNFIWCTTLHRCYKKMKNPGAMFQCIAGSCYVPYSKLSQECVSCCVSGFNTPTQSFQTCAANGVPVPNIRRINTPGLLVLSKSPIRRSRYVDYHPYALQCIERGYLEADVDGLGTVVCTHTTNNLPLYLEIDLTVKGVFRSYVEQGDKERGDLIANFGQTSPLILMGDFNVGDAFSPFLRPDLPERFSMLADVFNVIPAEQCTLCWAEENPYHLKAKGIVNTAVDHVFYKGHAVKAVKRVFTPLDVVLLNGLPLSDHNGVMAVIQPTQC